MCGRFCIAASPGELSERYHVQIPNTYIPRYNLAPAEQILFISTHSSHHTARIGTFGYSAHLKTRVINARSETVLEKSLFKQVHTSGRCLIPASGYYEWKQETGHHIPFYIYHPDYPVISFAGLTRSVAGIDEVVILTREAEGSLQSIHSRMPLILSLKGETDYLSGVDPRTLDRPDCSELKMHQVSDKVNRPGTEGPDLILPLRKKESQQTLTLE